MKEATSQQYLIALMLPEGVLDYFVFTHCSYSDTHMCIHLEEKNLIPTDYDNEIYK